MADERNTGVVTLARMTGNFDLRLIMRHWPAGVSVVTAHHPPTNYRYGMTVSTLTSLALEPPLISVFLQKDTETAQAIVETGVFGVSTLNETQAHLSNRFAGYDPAYPDPSQRLIDLPLIYATTGVPLLAEALTWLDCKVWAVYDGSTHHIVVGEVLAVSPLSENPPAPLVYYNQNYRKLVDMD